MKDLIKCFHQNQKIVDRILFEKDGLLFDRYYYVLRLAMVETAATVGNVVSKICGTSHELGQNSRDMDGRRMCGNEIQGNEH